MLGQVRNFIISRGTGQTAQHFTVYLEQRPENYYPGTRSSLNKQICSYHAKMRNTGNLKPNNLKPNLEIPRAP